MTALLQPFISAENVQRKFGALLFLFNILATRENCEILKLLLNFFNVCEMVKSGAVLTVIFMHGRGMIKTKNNGGSKKDGWMFLFLQC